MARVHTGWKVTLGAFFLFLGALGVLLFLLSKGVIHLEAPRKETALLKLPEGVGERDVCMERVHLDYCWMEVRNQPGCFVWADTDWPEQEFQWFGECSEGLAQGQGTLVMWLQLDLSFMVLSFFESEQEGMVVKGRRQGDWSARSLFGKREERSYVLGFRHGLWEIHHRNGTTEEVPYQLGRHSDFPILRDADGERILNSWERPLTEDWPYDGSSPYRHGMRRVTGADGEIENQFFVENSRVIAWRPAELEEEPKATPFPDNNPTGYYALSLEDGTEAEGPFVDGNMHGEWTFRSRYGSPVSSGQYDENRRTGRWIETYYDGRVAQGPYRGGFKHGDWTVRYSRGDVHKGAYERGARRGVWVMTEPDGLVAEGSYGGDRPYGEWVYYHPDGKVERGFRVGGVKHGEWSTTLPDGTVREGYFRDGSEYGEWLVTDPSGTEARGEYSYGKRSGNWVLRAANGEVQEGPYLRGERHGIWTTQRTDGSVIEEQWENGVPVGQP